jgi:hypothetical protein
MFSPWFSYHIFPTIVAVADWHFFTGCKTNEIRPISSCKTSQPNTVVEKKKLKTLAFENKIGEALYFQGLTIADITIYSL